MNVIIILTATEDFPKDLATMLEYRKKSRVQNQVLARIFGKDEHNDLPGTAR